MSTPDGADGGPTNAEPGQEQSFLSHLIELRQRLVRAAIAIIIVFLALSPFMKEIFVARIAFDAYLDSSALAQSITMIGAPVRVNGA